MRIVDALIEVLKEKESLTCTECNQLPCGREIG